MVGNSAPCLGPERTTKGTGSIDVLLPHRQGGHLTGTNAGQGGPGGLRADGLAWGSILGRVECQRKDPRYAARHNYTAPNASAQAAARSECRSVGEPCTTAVQQLMIKNPINRLLNQHGHGNLPGTSVKEEPLKRLRDDSTSRRIHRERPGKSIGCRTG